MKIDKQVLLVLLLAVGSSLSASAAFSEYSTSVDVYLDPATSGGADVDDTRWEFSSAVSQVGGDQDCEFRRDFIFTCGWYNNEGGSGTPEWTCSASNNSVGNPKGNDPFTLPQSEASWYTFRHVFKDVGGVLSVDFEILDVNGSLLNTWTRSDPTDLIDTVVSGNRYGWFVRIGCTSVVSGSCAGADDSFRLPIDNTQKCFGDSGCDFFQGFETDTVDWIDFGLETDTTDSNIARVPSGTNGIVSSSGGFHAQLSPSVTGGVGSFTRWNGYCTEGPFPSEAPSMVPTPEPACSAKCNVPLEITGLCDLDVLLECEDGSKASKKGKGKGNKYGKEGDPSTFDPSLVMAVIKCDCAEGTSPLTDEKENFCLSLEAESCLANLDVIGSKGSVQCVVGDVTITLTANVPEPDSKSKSKGGRTLLPHSGDSGSGKGKGKGSSSKTPAEMCEL